MFVYWRLPLECGGVSALFPGCWSFSENCHSAWVARREWRSQLGLRRDSGPLNHIKGGVERIGQSADHSQEEYQELSRLTEAGVGLLGTSSSSTRRQERRRQVRRRQERPWHEHPRHVLGMSSARRLGEGEPCVEWAEGGIRRAGGAGTLASRQGGCFVWSGLKVE